MKHLILIISLLLSVGCLAQNRFEKEYFCDTCFLNYGSSKADSIKFNKAIEEMNDTSKVTLTVEQCLLIYFNGYINGSLNYRQKKAFDFDNLQKDIVSNRKSLKRYIKFKQSLKI